MDPDRESREDFFTVQARHVRQCLREAAWAAGLWLAGMVWCGSVIVTAGYLPVDERPAEPELVFGLPAWVVWGLFLPWIVMVAATWWFALYIMKEDEPYLEFPNEDETTADSS